MRPRLAGDGLPQGSRKKSKKTPTQKTHKHEGRPPSPSFECTCFDCTTHPGTHPQTGLPSRGCWLSKKEFDAHSRAHRERGVADHLLASLDPPQLQLPVPEFGFLPRPLHRTLEPSSSRAPEVIHGSHPDPVNRDISRDLVLGQEIQAFYDHLRRTEDVIAGQAVVFDSPPHKDTKVDITLLDAEDIIQLCSLNPAVHSNSQIIGFQEYLAAVKKWLTLNPTKSISNVNLRLRVTTLQRRVNSEAAKLQKVLLEQWLHQENIVKLTYAFDSSKPFPPHLLTHIDETLSQVLHPVFLIATSRHSGKLLAGHDSTLDMRPFDEPLLFCPWMPSFDCASIYGELNQHFYSSCQEGNGRRRPHRHRHSGCQPTKHRLCLLPKLLLPLLVRSRKTAILSRPL